MPGIVPPPGLAPLPLALHRSPCAQCGRRLAMWALEDDTVCAGCVFLSPWGLAHADALDALLRLVRRTGEGPGDHDAVLAAVVVPYLQSQRRPPSASSG